jgi:hypothetical protein
MEIGITATQIGMQEEQMRTVGRLISQFLHGDKGHMGDCIGGDVQFANLVRIYKGKVVAHPPNVDTKRAFYEADIILEPKWYTDRNKDICNDVHAAGGFMIGAPKDFEMPSNMRGQGTWSTIAYCLRQNIPVAVVYPDGSATFHKGAPGG